MTEGIRDSSLSSELEINEIDSQSRMAMEEELRKCVICVVCGQQAHGMYFGAIVCLPCKSFFIRCTKEGQPRFNCQGTRSCNIQGGNRMRCQYCRYKRCIDAGMARKEKPEKIEPAEGQELCRVCSDIANGIHFGVMTCEGCKKFFRRALKECNSYVCKYRQTCQLNPRNRNACRYCRYQKCLQLGMSRKAIRMGRPRKSKGSGGRLQSISSLFKRSVSQYSAGYTGGSDSGSSDSGQMEDYSFLAGEHHQMQTDYRMSKYHTQMPGPVHGAVKNEPADRFSSQSQCAQQWGAPREPWPQSRSSPPQGGTPPAPKMEYEQPPPCSFTGLLAEASMPPASHQQVTAAAHTNQFSSAAIGESVPLSYDTDELNEILAMLPIDSPLNSHFIHHVQSELRSLVREANFDSPHVSYPSHIAPSLPPPSSKVILNTPTLSNSLRSERAQPEMMVSEPVPVSLPSISIPPAQHQTPPSVHQSPVAALPALLQEPHTPQHQPPTPLQQPHTPLQQPHTMMPHCHPSVLGQEELASNPHVSPVPHVHDSPDHIPQSPFTPHPVPLSHVSPIAVLNNALLAVDEAAAPLSAERDSETARLSLTETDLDENDWSRLQAQIQRSPNLSLNHGINDQTLTKALETEYGNFASLFPNQELPVK